MGRIRCIKPEFAGSELMGHVSRDARLTFILMWPVADDEGRLRANHRFLAHTLFPYDSDAEAQIHRWLKELEGQGAITTYHTADGAYIQINNYRSPASDWGQKIDHPRLSRIQAPDVGQRSLQLVEPSARDADARKRAN